MNFRRARPIRSRILEASRRMPFVEFPETTSNGHASPVKRTDTLPLCAFRAVFAAWLVWWYVDLFPDITALFTDDGILPRAAGWGGLFRAHRFSLMDAIGSTWAATAFVVAGLCAALL